MGGPAFTLPGLRRPLFPHVTANEACFSVLFQPPGAHEACPPLPAGYQWLGDVGASLVPSKYGLPCATPSADPTPDGPPPSSVSAVKAGSAAEAASLTAATAGREEMSRQEPAAAAAPAPSSLDLSSAPLLAAAPAAVPTPPPVAAAAAPLPSVVGKAISAAQQAEWTRQHRAELRTQLQACGGDWKRLFGL
eukprot:NODE_3556_length_657_cov_23.958882_g2540_i0.p2 GENE.NODE_3556_length_657_cov_23.958882_g2540_i0~~NODE_3556_length_657_cov_23.958882_g2540_i0.p2  ORF type:complete len:199 (+),score=61.30 NODE_3556_length_657_cov_23.958882_g2540_i0:22-597(+)